MFDTWKKLHTLCHVAAQDHKQYILKVTQTLQEGDDINATTWDEKTALHFTLMDPSYKSAHVVASLLIDHGCNIHLKDNNGQTALHYAARNGDLSIIKKLLENKADIHDTDIHYKTPIHYAIETENINAVRYLLSAGPTYKHITWPAYTQNNASDWLSRKLQHPHPFFQGFFTKPLSNWTACMHKIMQHNLLRTSEYLYSNIIVTTLGLSKSNTQDQLARRKALPYDILALIVNFIGIRLTPNDMIELARPYLHATTSAQLNTPPIAENLPTPTHLENNPAPAERTVLPHTTKNPQNFLGTGQ